MLALVVCRLLSQVEKRPCGFYCDRRNFYCPQGLQLSRLANRILMELTKSQRRMSWSGRPALTSTCRKLAGEGRYFIVKYYILYSETDRSSPANCESQRSDRKFDKSFSSLVSLYCSHYLPVVTSKLFFFFQLFNFAIFNYLENLPLPPGH